jgi:DNA-binding NarL/FixJ family response regulator
VRVVIGEDEALLREGLALVLGTGGFEVVATAGDAVSLIDRVRVLAPDLVITDIRMPPGYTDEGLRAALEIRRTTPRIPIVVLSQHLSRRVALELVAGQAAGVGYLLKQRIADVSTFRRDLVRVCEGGTVLDPEVVSLMVARARADKDGLRRLTARQAEVLALMAAGRSNASIARALSLTERAVVQHVSNIYDQLGLPASDDDHRRVLAVIRYLSRLASLEVRDRCDDAAVVAVGRGQAELGEDVGHVLFHHAGRDEQDLGDGGVRPALRDQRQHLPLAAGERGEGIGVPAAGQQLPDDLGVEHCPAAGHAADGLDEVADVRDPVLEQVADPGGGSGEEFGCRLDLDVLGEHQDADVGMVAADGQRRPQPLVGVRGRHPDVDDGHVGAVLVDRF